MDLNTETRNSDLEKRLDAVAWGLLFLLFAALALPSGNLEYVSAAAVGGAMVLLNAVRMAVRVAVGWFSLVLGASMLIAGSAAVSGVKMDVFVVFFALAGIAAFGSALVPRPRRTAARA